MQIMDDKVLYELMPVLIVAAASSFVMIVSNGYNGSSKITFQTVCFGMILCISTLALTQSNDAEQLFTTFAGANETTKLAVTGAVFSIVYFAAGFYLNAGENVSGIALTPASCDTTVTFDVPAELPESDKDLFIHCFQRFKDEIVSDLKEVYELNEEALDWVNRMIEYTCMGGKMNRGLTVMAVQKEFIKENLTNKQRLQSAALGWSIEFLQAFFLVADDVMDASKTRRGQPCWYKLPEVKLIAINDSFILESCVYKILKRYFGSEPYYPALLDLMIEVTRQTEMGQLLDLTSGTEGSDEIDFTRYTMDRLKSIHKYKTAFYTFYLPVAMGMICSGITDRSQYKKALEILLIMGEYFQIQDDVLDCYGTPEQIGKIGTDIQDKKCSWLIVKALERCNKRQYKILEDNYGSWDAAKVARIKTVYKELQLLELFQEYEEASYKKIKQLIAKVDSIPPGVFDTLLMKIYKRKK
jgi:farnesyl diphosphate synthase